MRDRLGQRAGHKRGPLTGPNPTDRGKNGSKIHLITDRNGLPLSLGISGANLHDSQALKPLVRGIPHLSAPRTVHVADARPDSMPTRDTTTTTCGNGSASMASATALLARASSPPPGWGGRHRWVVERTVSWLVGCRRLHRRYERTAEHFLAFVGLAAALIGYRRLAR